MKSTRDFRSDRSEETTRKATRLSPIRKSGKERHSLYKSLGDDQDEDAELLSLRRRESALDYLDDGEEDEEAEA